MTRVQKGWLLLAMIFVRKIWTNFEGIVLTLVALSLVGVSFYGMATDGPKQERADMLVEGRIAGWLSENQISYERLVDCFGARGEGFSEGTGSGTCNVVIKSTEPMAQVTCDQHGCYRRQ